MAVTLYPLYTISRFDLPLIDINVDKSNIQNMITLLKPLKFSRKKQYKVNKRSNVKSKLNFSEIKVSLVS